MSRLPRASKVIFDTNVYIKAIHGSPEDDTYQLLLSTLPRTYLSAIVVQELYAGALDAFGARLVDKFVLQTERTGRIVVPTYRDWKEAGRILARINRQQPAERARTGRLVSDVLLAMSAVQIGAKLYTFNGEDFRLIARYRQLSLETL